MHECILCVELSGKEGDGIGIIDSKGAVGIFVALAHLSLDEIDDPEALSSRNIPLEGGLHLLGAVVLLDEAAEFFTEDCQQSGQFELCSLDTRSSMDAREISASALNAIDEGRNANL